MGGRGISPALRWKAERSKTPQQRVQAGDFVVLRQGAAGGGFAVVPEAFDKSILSTNFMRFAINDSIVDRKWWRWRIQSPAFTEMCARAGMGSAQSFLTARKLLALDVAVPVLSEQHRIVAVLEQADRAVEAAARHVADTEALLKAMIDTEVGRVELPDEWALRPLEQIVTQKNDWVRVTPDAAYRLLGVRVRGAGAYDRGAIVGAKTKYPKFNVAEAGDLVLSKIWARNGAIAVIDSATSGCSASPEFPLFSPHQNEVLSSWLRLYMSLPRAWEDCERLAKGTSGQNRITPAQFLRMEIPLPPLAEQQAIVARIEKVEAAVRAAEAHLERLRALRSSLLENLVSGRVRLPMPDATASEAAA